MKYTIMFADNANNDDVRKVVQTVKSRIGFIKANLNHEFCSVSEHFD